MAIIVDLSHIIFDGLLAYPGDSNPELKLICSTEKDSFTNHWLNMGMHTGTHIDGRWHMTKIKTTIAEVQIERFIGKACLIDIRNYRIYAPKNIEALIPEGCSIVLFFTGMSAKYNTQEYYRQYPTLDKSIVKGLLERNISLIGIDSASPDYEPYDTHIALLENNILIIENLTNLHLLPNNKVFDLIALPLKIDVDSAPARVVAIL